VLLPEVVVLMAKPQTLIARVEDSRRLGICSDNLLSDILAELDYYIEKEKKQFARIRELEVRLVNLGCGDDIRVEPKAPKIVHYGQHSVVE
jgi:hypothetical protein